MVKQAIVLAAGLGTRMKDLVNEIPKPMVSVDGITLIERHLNRLLKNNISKVIINTHYKAEIFENFVKSLPIYSKLEIIFSREELLLGTAGGVKNALKFLGDEPFFVINSDSIFPNQEDTAFNQLKSAWDPTIMPMILLLARKEKSFGYWASGDFDMDVSGRLNQNNKEREFINPGMYLTDYRLFQPYSEQILQFPEIFADLMKENKLYGCVYGLEWLHIGDLKAYTEYHS